MVAERGGPTLVRICGPDGKPRGTGFLADEQGTVMTSHEAVDGLDAVIVRPPSGASGAVEAEGVTPLPERDLALVHTGGLGPEVAPLVIGAQRPRPAGRPVRLRIGEWIDAEIAGTAEATYTYTSTHRFHPLAEVLELSLPQEAYVQLRLSKEETGTPVLDGRTGAVLAVLGTALHSPRRAAVFAVPLRGAWNLEPGGPVDGALGALLARNGSAVPGFGRDLNLAGALQLTATSAGPAVERAEHAVPRPEVARILREFDGSPASVAALVGRPGAGRTTELAALAARRARGAAPEPTVWLRGADLRPSDGSVRDAVVRALGAAGRIVTASLPLSRVGDPGGANADVVARLARDAGRPLLVVLDGPEEMPPRLARDLRRWTAGTAGWLRASGARMVLACRPEYWEQAGVHFPADLLFTPARPPGSGEGADGAELPPCLPIGGLSPEEAERVRARYGLPGGLLPEGQAHHPQAVRMLSEIRAAQMLTGREDAVGGPLDRTALFSAHLDLLCLRIAVRLAVPEGPAAPGPGVLRRFAAVVAGRVHEAARRVLGPGQGELDADGFAELFPWAGGWAPAVLAEEVLVPAGDGYRFADEEFADWVQGRHLEAGAALESLLAAGDGEDGPVPRHRIGPVVEALVLCGREQGPAALTAHLERLVGHATGQDAAQEPRWWAEHLLRGTLLHLPDAGPYLPLLRDLAGRIVRRGRTGPFGPGFWTGLPLTVGDCVALLRLLLPADAPHGDRGPQEPRFLDAVAGLLVQHPRTVQPLLCGWFGDRSGLRRRDDVPTRRVPDVGTAAQALLYTYRGRAPEALLEALLDCGHPEAEALLGELVHEETSAVCRAVVRWAQDGGSNSRLRSAACALRLAAAEPGDDDRALLRCAALALLRSGDEPVRGRALAVLLRDPVVGHRYFDRAVEHFAATGAPEVAEAFAALLGCGSGPVPELFRTLLRQPGAGAPAVTGALAQHPDPRLAPRVAALLHEYAELRPETAGPSVAAYLRCRLAEGAGARDVVQPLVAVVLRDRPTPVRAAVAAAVGGSGGPLRDELVGLVLQSERAPAVLGALLTAAVHSRRGADDEQRETGALVRRVGRIMNRTPEGAEAFEETLLQLAREVPGFAGRARAWVARARSTGAPRTQEALSDSG